MLVFCDPQIRADESTAPADQRSKQAQIFVDQAYVAYERANWSEAITKYLDSYALVPTPEVLFNVARIYERRLGNKELALEYYRRCSTSPDATPELISKSRERIAELSLSRDQPIVARPLPEPAPKDRSFAFRTSGIASGAAGLAAIGLGIGFGVSAMSNASAAHGAGCSGGACPDPSSAAQDRTAFTYGAVSTVGFVLGAALTAVGITLLAISPRMKRKAEASIHAQAVGLGSAGVTF